MIESKVPKKYGFTFPAILQNNPYLSAAFSIIGLVISGSVNKDKKTDLNKAACIMDFTVRMHNDKNLIYYETGYLQEANMTLKRDCEMLFAECVRQVGYTISLENCRTNDDWERLYVLLDNLVDKSLGEEKTGNNTAIPDQFRHLKSDIEQTLEKFNSAYRMPEVQGSKLKDMLYGVSDN